MIGVFLVGYLVEFQTLALPGACSATLPATRRTWILRRNLRRSMAILLRRFSRIQSENSALDADPRESTLLRNFQSAC